MTDEKNKKEQQNTLSLSEILTFAYKRGFDDCAKIIRNSTYNLSNALSTQIINKKMSEMIEKIKKEKNDPTFTVKSNKIH